MNLNFLGASNIRTSPQPQKRLTWNYLLFGELDGNHEGSTLHCRTLRNGIYSVHSNRSVSSDALRLPLLIKFLFGLPAKSVGLN